MRTTVFAIALIFVLSISGLFAQARTTPVTVSNTPTVKVDASANTVKIDPGSNVVASPALSKTVQLWAAQQVIPVNGTLDGPSINCSGYREIRVVIGSAVSSANLKVNIMFSNGAMSFAVGSCSFGPVTGGVVSGTGFVNNGYVCSFTVPVMSDTFSLNVSNGTGASATISNASWVYLVN